MIKPLVFISYFLKILFLYFVLYITLCFCCLLWGYTQEITVYGRKDKFEIVLSFKLFVSQAGLELVLLLLSSRYWDYRYGPLRMVFKSLLLSHI
jgi:hypothetical protein